MRYSTIRHLNMVLLDTCALLWWTIDPTGLSEKAVQICNRISDEGAFISSISIWEIGIKMQKGVLDFGDTLKGFVKRLKRIGSVEIIPVDETIWIENVLLDWTHRDPADRTIVATAMLRNLLLLTKDQIIRDFYRQVIW